MNLAFPFAVYWPGKDVPAWLERVTFKGTSDGSVPCCRHDGFGVITNRGGIFHIWGLTGNFIFIRAAGMCVEVRGQGRGVHYHHTFHVTRRVCP